MFDNNNDIEKMSDFEASEDSAALPADTDAFENEVTTDTALYPSDTGLLQPMTRQVLVHLLKGPYFDRRTSTKLWDELKNNEETIRSRLSDLYLDLLIDDEIGVAFCRKPDLGEHEAPTLLTTARLKFLDSAVLLELRERLMRARADGERAFVTLADLADMLRLYDRTSETDAKAFANHLTSIRKRLMERRILIELKSGDSLEISPILPLLFPTADIARLRQAYIDRMLSRAETEEEAQQLRQRYALEPTLADIVLETIQEDDTIANE